MAVQLMPVVSGLEAGAAALAGHIPGVALGLFSLAWTLALRPAVAENAAGLTPAADALSSLLGAWTMVVLGVRVLTFGPDPRYAAGFPTDVAHPAGCTRVAPTAPCRSRNPPPVFKGKSVERVQGLVREWIKAQPRATILKDEPGYMHAQVLSLLMGFPDNLGVKVVEKGGGTDKGVEVWVQGELRVGEGDLGVNARRVKALLDHLEKAQ